MLLTGPADPILQRSPPHNRPHARKGTAKLLFHRVDACRRCRGGHQRQLHRQTSKQTHQHECQQRKQQFANIQLIRQLLGRSQSCNVDVDDVHNDMDTQRDSLKIQRGVSGSRFCWLFCYEKPFSIIIKPLAPDVILRPKVCRSKNSFFRDTHHAHRDGVFCKFLCRFLVRIKLNGTKH